MGPFETSERGVRGGTWWHGGRKAVRHIAGGQGQLLQASEGLVRPGTLAR